MRRGGDQRSRRQDVRIAEHEHRSRGRPGAKVEPPSGVERPGVVGEERTAAPRLAQARQRPLLDDDQVPAYDPVAAVYYDGMYFAFLTDGKCVIYDVPDPVFKTTVKAPMTTASVYATAAASTLTGRLVLAGESGSAYDWDWISGNGMSVQYQTSFTRLTQDAVFTAAKVQGKGVYGVLKCYDGRGLRWSRPVQGDHAVRVPAYRCTGAVSLEFTGDCEYISAFEVSTSMGELANT